MNRSQNRKSSPDVEDRDFDEGSRRRRPTLREWLDEGVDSRDEIEADDAFRPRRNYDLDDDRPRRTAERSARIVDAAMRRVEDRTERRTADALESVARWLHRSERERRDGEDAIFERLAALDEKLARPAPAVAASDFERRMRSLAARAESADPTLRRQPQVAEPPVSPAPEPVRPPATRDADVLREELRRASEKLAELRRSAPAERPAAAEISALRGDLHAMARLVADLAPRNSVVALEGALRDLSARVASLGDLDARRTLLAPVNAAIVDLRDAVRAQNVPQIAEALDLDIRALSAKVDGLAASTVDRTAFDGIRRQMEETRLLLDDAVGRMAPLERLERRVGALADQIDALSASPRAAAESKQMLAAVEDLRDSVERSAPTALLSSIEARLEALTQRIEKELSQPKRAAIFDVRALEGLGERIDAVRKSVEARPPGPDAERFDQSLRELSDKLDRMQAPAFDIKPLEAALTNLSQRPIHLDANPLGEAIRSLGAKIDARPAAGEFAAIVASVQGLADRMDSMRKSVEARAQGSDVARLETMLKDLAGKVERPAPPPLDVKPLETALSSLSQRPIHLDSSPLGDVIQALDAKIDSRLQAMSGSAELASIEGMLRDLSEKIERRPPPAPLDVKPLEAALASLSQRPITLDSSPLGDAIEALNAKIDSRFDSWSGASELASIEAALHDLADKLDRRSPPAPIDIKPLESALNSLSQRPLHLDETPLGDAIRTLNAKLDERPAPPDLEGIEQTLARLADRIEALDARSASGGARGPDVADAAALEAAIRDLAAKIDGQAPLARDVEELRQSLVAAPGGQAAAEALESVWRRIDAKLSTALDPGEWTSEIAGIHQRLDAIDATAREHGHSEAVLESLAHQIDEVRRAVSDLLSTRESDSPALAARFAELHAAQAESDEATHDRLSKLAQVLETLVDRIDHMEVDGEEPQPKAARWTAHDEPVFAPPQVSADVAPEPAAIQTVAQAATASLAAKGPPAAPVAPPAESAPRAPEKPRVEPTLAMPQPTVDRDAQEDEAKAEPASDRTAPGLPDHIAAARRAAQAALAQTGKAAAVKAAAPVVKPLPSAATKAAKPASSGPGALGAARSFVAQRRRPILLGVALVVMIAAYAALNLRNGHGFLMKSEADTPAASAVAEVDSGLSHADSPAPALDKAPVGSIPANPSPPPAAEPQPGASPAAELFASVPVWAPQPLRDALAKNDPAAQYELASRYIDGRGAPRDPAAGAKWLAAAAAQSLAPAQYRLASLYERGIGVNKDLAQAKALYMKAAEAGNARAMHNLGVLFAESIGDAKPNFVEAGQWFRKAAKFGVKDSQFNLGILEARGLGGAQDFGQAWVYFSLAAQQGDIDAARKRDDVAAKLDPAGLASAQQALAAFRTETPLAAANDVVAPSGGWDGKPAASLPSPAASPAQTPAKTGA